jgi:hypothetical protein
MEVISSPNQHFLHRKAKGEYYQSLAITSCIIDAFDTEEFHDLWALKEMLVGDRQVEGLLKSAVGSNLIDAVFDSTMGTTLDTDTNTIARPEIEQRLVWERLEAGSTKSQAAPIPSTEFSANPPTSPSNSQQCHPSSQNLSVTDTSSNTNLEPEKCNMPGNPPQITSSRLRPGKRQKFTEAINALGEVVKPLEDTERRRFKGFVELESEPVSYFCSDC